MDFMYVFWSALVQGLTEFLPVSSSAHLILLPYFMGVPDQGLPLDIAVHVGSLVAVIIYFRRELCWMTRDFFKYLAGKGPTPYSRLAIMIILATIPVCLAGLFLHDLIEHEFRSPVVIGIMSIVFGILLGIADRRFDGQSTLESIGFKQAIYIGLAQIASLIPGASRSGVTITMGRFLGLNREISAKFSFILSIPVILAATILEGYTVHRDNVPFEWADVGVGFVISAIVALLVVHAFIKLIERIGMMPFVIYRIILGIVLCVLFL